MGSNKPIKGELWKYRESGKFLLVTDVHKKKNDDDYLYSDDEYNTAKKGQVFIYSIYKESGLTVSARGPLEEFLNLCEFEKKVMRCICPNCNKHHVNWTSLNG